MDICAFVGALARRASAARRDRLVPCEALAARLAEEREFVARLERLLARLARRGSSRRTPRGFPSSSLGEPLRRRPRARLFGRRVLQLMTIAIAGPHRVGARRGAERSGYSLAGAPSGRWAPSDRRQRNGVRVVRPVGSRRNCAARTTARHCHRARLAAARCAACRGRAGRHARDQRVPGAFVVFSDTFTPLARTFPAWVSIVSGKHPHSTGAVMNLLDARIHRRRRHAAAAIGRRRLSHRLCDRRSAFLEPRRNLWFSRADRPAMGASDFLLSFFADTPFMNLLVNTAAGGGFFPTPTPIAPPMSLTTPTRSSSGSTQGSASTSPRFWPYT